MRSPQSFANMRKTVLITIGRLPKALDFARSFHADGWRVIVADPHRWHLTGVSRSVARSYAVTPPATDRGRYLDELLDIIRREQVELVLPVSEETMYVTALAEQLPSGVRLFAMPHAEVLRLHDKLAFPALAKAHGLSAPETYALTDPRAQELASASDVVIKPNFSCSGRGVSFVSKGAGLPPSNSGEPTVVQEWIKGDLFSTFTIAHGGRVHTTIVYRAAVMSGTVAVCFERVTNQTTIEDWVARFTAAENYTGFIAFDMIVDEAGTPHAIECNPRATSGVHFIEPSHLAAAILRPAAGQPAKLRPNLTLQQFYPCLTETQISLFKGGPFRTNLKHLVTSRDVCWQLSDPLPLVLMPITAAGIMRLAFLKGQSFGEAATFDIAWAPPLNGE
jgi:hypothetical protein